MGGCVALSVMVIIVACLYHLRQKIQIKNNKFHLTLSRQYENSYRDDHLRSLFIFVEWLMALHPSKPLMRAPQNIAAQLHP